MALRDTSDFWLCKRLGISWHLSPSLAGWRLIGSCPPATPHSWEQALSFSVNTNETRHRPHPRKPFCLCHRTAACLAGSLSRTSLIYEAESQVGVRLQAQLFAKQIQHNQPVCRTLPQQGEVYSPQSSTIVSVTIGWRMRVKTGSYNKTPGRPLDTLARCVASSSVAKVASMAALPGKA